MRINKSTVDHLEYTFPVIVRYVGLITTVVLIGFCLAGYALEAAPGFVPAAGMLLYKTVHDAARGMKSDGNKDEDERWSHLP